MSTKEVISSLQSLSSQLKSVQSLLRQKGAKQVNSETEKEACKSLAQYYFRSFRPGIIQVNLDSSELDECFQNLIRFSSTRTPRLHYLRTFNSIRRLLTEFEIKLELQENQVGSPTPFNREELQILKVLKQINPLIGVSYEQIILDLSNEDRKSYRGTSAELREVLREVLDHLAEDEAVINDDNFTFEEGLNKPTMKQKATFILKSKGMKRTEIKPAEKSIETIDAITDSVSSMTRDLYKNSSISAHTSVGIFKDKAKQAKMYFDAVLCDLLEIHYESKNR